MLVPFPGGAVVVGPGGGPVDVMERESVGVGSVIVAESVGVGSVTVPLFPGSKDVVGRGIGKVTMSDPLVEDGSRRLDKKPPRPLEVVVGEGAAVTPVPGPVTPSVDVGFGTIPPRSDDKKSVVAGSSLVGVFVGLSEDSDLLDMRPPRSEDKKSVFSGSSLVTVFVAASDSSDEVGFGDNRVDKNVLRPGSSPSSFVDFVSSESVLRVKIPPGPNVIALSVPGNKVVTGLVGALVVVGLTIMSGISPVGPRRGSRILERSRPSLLVVLGFFDSLELESEAGLVSSEELVGDTGERMPSSPSNSPPVVPAEDGEESPVVNPFKKSVNERFVEKEVKGSCLVFSGANVVFTTNWRFTCLGK